MPRGPLPGIGARKKIRKQAKGQISVRNRLRVQNLASWKGNDERVDSRRR